MFSEDIILGQKECKIDPKGRFFLPKFTYAQTNDKLVLNDNNGIFEIYLLKIIEDKMNKLNNLIINSNNIEEIELLKCKLNLLYISCIFTANVDSQKRLLLPNDFRNEYSFLNHVYTLGANDHIKIFNSLESLNNYKKSLKRK